MSLKCISFSLFFINFLHRSWFSWYSLSVTLSWWHSESFANILQSWIKGHKFVCLFLFFKHGISNASCTKNSELICVDPSLTEMLWRWDHMWYVGSQKSARSSRLEIPAACHVVRVLCQHGLWRYSPWYKMLVQNLLYVMKLQPVLVILNYFSVMFSAFDVSCSVM
jgi:hypothetical protein